MAYNLPTINRKASPLNVEEVRVVNAVSPRVTLTDVSNGVVMRVQDAFGDHTVTIYDGQTGVPGPSGRGISGVTLNQDYSLTLSFTDGSSYTTSSIRGAQGEQGIQGVQGPAGEDYVLTNADKEAIALIAEGHFTEPVTQMYDEIVQAASDVSAAATQVDEDKTATLAAKEAAETAMSHYPIIQNGYWWVWDVDDEEYVDTGYKAQGETGETGSEHTVKIQTTQPTEAANKLWVPLEGQGYDVEVLTAADVALRLIVECTHQSRPNGVHHVLPVLPDGYEFRVGEFVIAKWPVNITVGEDTLVTFNHAELRGVEVGMVFVKDRYYMLRHFTELVDDEYEFDKFELVNLSFPAIES